MIGSLACTVLTSTNSSNSTVPVLWMSTSRIISLITMPGTCDPSALMTWPISEAVMWPFPSLSIWVYIIMWKRKARMKERERLWAPCHDTWTCLSCCYGGEVRWSSNMEFTQVLYNISHLEYLRYKFIPMYAVGHGFSVWWMMVQRRTAS